MGVIVFDPDRKLIVAATFVVCRRSLIGVLVPSSLQQQPLFSFL
ncbi:hypothetical protein A2U01_0026348, partial [Trifolium medium]|nr:hypothetical protein [Trifolium medium]